MLANTKTPIESVLFGTCEITSYAVISNISLRNAVFWNYADLPQLAFKQFVFLSLQSRCCRKSTLLEHLVFFPALQMVISRDETMWRIGNIYRYNIETSVHVYIRRSHCVVTVFSIFDRFKLFKGKMLLSDSYFSFFS